MQAWGKGYFGINASGHVVVRPDTTEGREIDLYEVVEGLQARDLTTPVVVRFSDILAHRLRRLHDSFAQAITENDYKNRYAAVYPIKVNQQRLVVEEVYRYGKEFGFGLEVGSKPELLAVMAMTENASERLIICNGFKDDSYIEAVTLATKLGRTIIPVVENFDELALILKHAQTYQVRPRMGVRVKLFSEGSGRWSASAGDKSKFGLFITEILELFAVLKQRDMLDCLQLVHCHPGSQLQDIRRVKDAINELAHVYAELKLMGAGLQYIDVGGGLGVDYDGSGTNFSSSMNYTLSEYANDVVYRIASVCNARDIPHPMIVSESGRAIAAYHSVLIFDTLGSSALDKFQVTGDPALDYQGDEELPQPVHGPVRCLPHGERAAPGRVLSRRAHRARAGPADVQPRAAVARVPRPRRAALLGDLRQDPRLLPQARALPEELEDLESILSDTYFCNFSVFQSLPDSWAIDQLFPIMPIHRLDERPTRTGVLADITCDSDGKIDRFVSLRDVKRTLELHELKPEREVLPRRLPGRRVPGDPRRPAQPLRRHARGARAPARRGRLVDRGNRQGRHRQQGARVHGVRRRRAVPGAGARLRARHPRRPHDARREPGAQALLRKRAGRLRVPGARRELSPRAPLARVAGPSTRPWAGRPSGLQPARSAARARPAPRRPRRRCG